MANKPNEPWVEAPNTVLAGPATGPDTAFASFRALIAADLVTAGVLPAAKFTLNAAAGPLVASAGDLSGAALTQAQYSNVNGSTLTTRTAAQMIADSGLLVGASYALTIANSAAGTLTLTAGVGVTLTGTATVATATTRTFNVTVTGAAALTITSVSSSPV